MSFKTACIEVFYGGESFAGQIFEMELFNSLQIYRSPENKNQVLAIICLSVPLLST